MHGVPWLFDFCMHMHETCMFTVMRGCRTKPKIDQTKSDKEIFNGLPMGDTWDDANMADVFFYIYRSAATHVPDSWHATMCKFAHDLQRSVGADHAFVDAYMVCQVGYLLVLI